MRKRIYEIIEASNGNDKLSSYYDVFIMIVIIVSLIPLAFKTSNIVFAIIDRICATIFIIDYFLRFITSDFKLKLKGIVSFLVYPFTFMAIIDLISILPSLTIIGKGFKLLKILRLFRTFRVFRTFKFIRYSKNIIIIVNIFKKQKKVLGAVATLAVSYVLLSALIVFNVEPDSFRNFFDAIYWATVSLTTVGYGDIYPITTIGRVVTMLSSVFGIAIIALPSGVFTASFLKELNKTEELHENRNEKTINKEVNKSENDG